MRDIQDQMDARGANENESMEAKMKKELDNLIYTLDGATAKSESKKFTFEVNKYISSDNDSDGDGDGGSDGHDSGDGSNPRTVTFAENDDNRGEERTTQRAGDRESMGFSSQLGQMDGFYF